MPILAVQAFVVRCDICRRYLTPLDGLPLLPDHPGPCFSTSAIATTAARANDWTLGRETATCPKCSPVKPLSKDLPPWTRTHSASQKRPEPSHGSQSPQRSPSSH